MSPRRLVLAVATVAACMALPAASASAALETIVQDDASLLHRPPEEVKAAMQRLKALGVDRVRLTASWSVLTRSTEATEKPAGFDAADPAAYEQGRFANLDTAVRLAREAGLKVLMDVGFWAPHWAANDPPGPRARTNVDPASYADFTAALARRYAGNFAPTPDPVPPPPSQDASFLNGLFGGGPSNPPPAPAPAAPGAPLPQVDEFALWNEPNIPALLLPQWTSASRTATPASPAVYRRMVQAAYPAGKAARPDATFLVGNTSSLGGTPGSGAVAPLRFLRDLACVDAKLRPLKTKDCAGFTTVPGDGFAHHPYGRNTRPDRPSPRGKPDDIGIADLGRLSGVLDRLASTHRISNGMRRIFLTEFGYETSRVAGRPTLSQTTQARWLTWAEYVASRVRGVVSFAQFLLRDQAPAAERVNDSSARAFGQYFSGLQSADGADKLAARSFTAGLFAQRRRGGRVLLYGRLRLGKGTKAIAVQRRLGGAKGKWRTLRTLRLDGQDSFTRVVRSPGSARFRLRYPQGDGHTVTSVAVPAVPPR